jgi:hypothetical protein
VQQRDVFDLALTLALLSVHAKMSMADFKSSVLRALDGDQDGAADAALGRGPTRPNPPVSDAAFVPLERRRSHWKMQVGSQRLRETA